MRRRNHLLTGLICLIALGLAAATSGQQQLNPNRAAPGPDAAFGRLLGKIPRSSSAKNGSRRKKRSTPSGKRTSRIRTWN